jgi:hypothetical protein
MDTDEDIVKSTMKKVNELLVKYEVAAVVVIHRPGYTQSLVKIEAPFSCAKHDTDGKIKIRAKLEDYKGDKNVRKQRLLDTSDMLRELLDSTVKKVYPYFDVSEQFDERLKADGIKR